MKSCQIGVIQEFIRLLFLRYIIYTLAPEIRFCLNKHVLTDYILKLLLDVTVIILAIVMYAAFYFQKIAHHWLH